MRSKPSQLASEPHDPTLTLSAALYSPPRNNDAADPQTIHGDGYSITFHRMTVTSKAIDCPKSQADHCYVGVIGAPRCRFNTDKEGLEQVEVLTKMLGKAYQRGSKDRQLQIRKGILSLLGAV